MNKSTFEQIGDKIRDLRLTDPRGALSQEMLAIRLGVTANRVAQWETGADESITEDLDKLARFFLVPISVFFPELPGEGVRIVAPTPEAAGPSNKILDQVLQYVQFRNAPPLQGSGEASIVCLTRGYLDLKDYDPLIERNRSIYEAINRHRARQYPLVVWHEGNILPEHQRYIASQELNSDLRFVDVSPVFQLPEGINEEDLVEHWGLGYRLMCRFHSYYIWQYAAQFDYIMRLDEDCTLTSVAFDPIQSLARAGGDFAAACFVKESHDLTNQTLAPFARKLAIALRPGKKEASVYNDAFPYTNVYVTRTAFWRRPEVQQFLFEVISNDEFVRFRWGDSPVLGIALNTFAVPTNVYLMSKVGYRHGSHNWTVEPAK